MIDFVIPTVSEEDGCDTAKKLKASLGELCSTVNVVVDGAGEEVVTLLRHDVRVIKKKNLDGSYVARNVGAKYCDKEFIGFIDDNVEVSVSKNAEEIVEDLREKACSGYVLFNSQPNNMYEEWYRRNAFDMGKFLNRFSFIPTIFIVLPKRAFDEVDGFDESYLSSGDVDFSKKISKHVKLELSEWICVKTDIRDKRQIFKKIRRQVYGQCYFYRLRLTAIRYFSCILIRFIYNLSGLSCLKMLPGKGFCYNAKYYFVNYRICLLKSGYLFVSLFLGRNALHKKMTQSNRLEVSNSFS